MADREYVFSYGDNGKELHTIQVSAERGVLVEIVKNATTGTVTLNIGDSNAGFSLVGKGAWFTLHSTNKHSAHSSIQVIDDLIDILTYYREKHVRGNL